ncbi:GDSL esterase/lipase [Nymphaea thermarum]|nr:GDSL esterase/lipase [Nymphaea thermarum]
MASSNATVVANQKFSYPSTLNVANFVSIELSQTNFLLWKTQVLGLIESQDLQGFINGEIAVPDQYKLQTHKKKSMTMADYIRIFKNTCDELQAIGRPVNDHTKVFLLLNGLGPEYESFVTSMLKPPIPTYKDGVESLVESVVNQTAVNLKRIMGLGVQKVAVMGLPPVGCIPLSTANTSYARCDAFSNKLVVYHNSLLQKAVDAIKVPLATHLPSPSSISTLPSPLRYKVHILSPFPSFLDPFQTRRDEDPLRRCCKGANSTTSCSSVDQEGNKLYEVCSPPVSTFF